MKEKNWSVHVEWVVLMITVIGGIYVINSEIRTEMRSQAARTDRLYEMFIDLVKERK
jgi:hypothetical protein